MTPRCAFGSRSCAAHLGSARVFSGTNAQGRIEQAIGCWTGEQAGELAP